MGGAQKLLLPFDGGPLVRRPVETALGVGPLPTCVVTGRASEEVVAALSDLPVETIENLDFAAGLATSVTRAIEWAEPLADGLVLLLGDEPGIDGSVVREAIDVWFDAPRLPLRVRYVDRPGHPVIIPLPVAPRDRPSGDTGMRGILTDAAVLTVDRPAPIDVDTETDYQQALARLRQ